MTAFERRSITGDGLHLAAAAAGNPTAQLVILVQQGARPTGQRCRQK
jgi:hypothetical protein